MITPRQCRRVVLAIDPAEKLCGPFRFRLDESNRLDHILNPKNAKADERRVTYVALSRAEDRLFLSVPALKDGEEHRLVELGVQVIQVP